MKNVQLTSCQILRPDPNLRTQGFTLLEVIIVMVLITLVIGISTVFFANTLMSSTFNTTVKDISSSLRYVRTLAQIHGERKTLTIDLDARTFSVQGRGTRQEKAS